MVSIDTNRLIFSEENIEPFCEVIGCGVEMRHPTELVENCAPVFYESQNPAADCNVAFRCREYLYYLLRFLEKVLLIF